MMALPALHQVIDELEVFICGLDERGTILLFNRPCEELTGVARHHAVGQNWLEMFPVGERRDHVVALWSQATTTGRPSGPFEALCRNGKSLRWQFSRWSLDAQDSLALCAVGFDMTQEREARARTRESERVVALGNLVAGLTHELRNPLNGALLQLTLAERYEARNPAGTVTPTAQAIAQASLEIRRISALLDDFLVFVRPLPVHLERIAVRRVVERALERGRVKARNAEVTLVLEPGDDVAAELDATRVESAVYHLLANAIDAAAEAPDRAREVRVRLAVHGNTIAIDVEDHGAGLPSKDAPIFEPFFTTKQGGTGLGLSIVERVASDLGGTIAYQRRDGATVFRLELPIVGGAGN